MSEAFFRFNRQRLERELESLTQPQKVAFLLSIAERFFPHYVSFHNEKSWGEPRLLRCALDAAWTTLTGRAVDVDLHRLAAEILQVCPDTERFEGPSVGLALAACSSAVYLLRFIQNEKLTEILEAAQAAADAADGHAGWVLFPGYVGEDTREMWQQQLEHPITQSELRAQEDALSALQQSGPLTEKMVEELRRKWRAQDRAVL